MNVQGLNDQIEFIDNHGNQQIAKLDGLKINMDPFEIGTRDPQWWVSPPPGNNFQGPYDWLRYRGTDGNNWKTYIHAEENDAEGNNYHIWFESTRTYSQDDNGNHDGDNPTFQIVDWQGKKWNVDYCASVPNTPEPHPVRFHMSPI